MEVTELLRSFDVDDIEKILLDSLPGIRHNSKDAIDEVMCIYEHIPALKSLVAKSVHYRKLGQGNKSKQYNIIINTLIMVYKKDKNYFIDKIMGK